MDKVRELTSLMELSEDLFNEFLKEYPQIIRFQHFDYRSHKPSKEIDEFFKAFYEKSISRCARDLRADPDAPLILNGFHKRLIPNDMAKRGSILTFDQSPGINAGFKVKLDEHDLEILSSEKVKVSQSIGSFIQVRRPEKSFKGNVCNKFYSVERFINEFRQPIHLVSPMKHDLVLLGRPHKFIEFKLPYHDFEPKQKIYSVVDGKEEEVVRFDKFRDMVFVASSPNTPERSSEYRSNVKNTVAYDLSNTKLKIGEFIRIRSDRGFETMLVNGWSANIAKSQDGIEQFLAWQKLLVDSYAEIIDIQQDGELLIVNFFPSEPIGYLEFDTFNFKVLAKNAISTDVASITPNIEEENRMWEEFEMGKKRRKELEKLFNKQEEDRKIQEKIKEREEDLAAGPYAVAKYAGKIVRAVDFEVNPEINNQKGLVTKVEEDVGRVYAKFIDSKGEDRVWIFRSSLGHINKLKIVSDAIESNEDDSLEVQNA